MYNKKIAEILDEVADMLELDEKVSRFEVLAYRKAAQSISTLQEDIEEIYKKKGVDGLMEIPGVGKSIAGSVKEYLDTGKMVKYEKLKKKYPIDFNNLTKIQGMGPKKAFRLYEELKVKNIDDLKKVLKQNKIRNLEGFGEGSEEVIKKGLELLESGSGRMILGIALPEAERIRDKLLSSKLAEKAVICGSTRRMRETVGDLDILVISDSGEKMMDFIAKLPEISSVSAKGPTRMAVRLAIGINCDFRLLKRESFGAAIQYFTGNKDHNVKVREIAIKKKLKLNEYGLFDKKSKNVAAGESEEEIYKTLGMEYIEPEMRENRGEVELALEHKLPKIIKIEEIMGDLHVHSKNSDGTETIEDIANEAARLGRKYIGMTDHSKSEYQAGGMDDKKFEKYFGEIDKVNDKLGRKIRMLKSGEVDILKDGSLDLKDSTLDQMDYVLASVHNKFGQDRDQMTNRIVKALGSGYVDILAHPTGRLVNQREAMPMDLDKVFEAAEKNKVVVEIDGFPQRSDLSDENVWRAKKYHLKFSVDTDAHRLPEMQFMRYGVGIAKRGWLRKEDVINTQTADGLLKMLKK